MKKFISYSLFIVSLIFTFSFSAYAYTDVDESTDYYKAIDYISNQDIVGGYPDGSYKPEVVLNRAELLKIVVEANFNDYEFQTYTNEECFDDVPAEQWYTKYVCFAKDKGIVNGYPDGTFRPADQINLVEAVKIVMEVFGYQIPEKTIWYQGYIDEAAERNFLPLDFTGFDQDMNRGQMADLITRVLKYRLDELEDYLGANYNHVVNFVTLEYGIDLTRTGLDDFYSSEIDLGFKYPEAWTDFDIQPGGDYFDGSYRVTDESNWKLYFGPVNEGGCEGEDCYTYSMEGFAAQDSDNVVGVMEDDSLIKLTSDSQINLNRVLIYEEGGICVNLSAIVFAGETIMFTAKCVQSDEESNDFYQILSTIYTGSPAPDAQTNGDDPDPADPDIDGNTEDRVALGAPDVGSIEFALFESEGFGFSIEYYNQWYYSGTAATEDGIMRNYTFTYDNPLELEDGEEVVKEVALDLLDTPYSGDGEEMVYGETTLYKETGETETMLHLVDGNRTYRLSGGSDYEDIMIHMALSVQDI